MTDKALADAGNLRGELAGTERVGQRLGPLGSMALHGCDDEAVLVELVVLVVEDEPAVLALGVLLPVLEFVVDGEDEVVWIGE